MIGKLRRRLILLVLAGLLLASAGLVATINLMNWQSLTKQVSGVLDMLAENGGARSPIQMLDRRDPRQGTLAAPPDDRVSWEENLRAADRRRREDLQSAVNLSNYYTVQLDAEGAVTAWSSDRADLYTEEEIAATVAQVLAHSADSGRIGDQFYRRVAQESGTLLIVFNAQLELQNARRVLRLTALVAVIEDALLSLGAILLIRRMVKPVAEAMEKQKQFVWDASHELKTPLAVISANAELLAQEAGDSKPLEYIQSEVQRTDKLLQSLLTLARMDKGSVQAESKPFDLSRALLSVALPFESAVFEAGKRMEMDIPDGIRYTGDEEMIKQLAVILLSNAQKYSDDRGLIRLSLEAKGERRILRVHNTGPAIPKDAQARIFDRFYRVDSSHNREIPGNGLGLAIAQNIVSAHHGKITVSSAEGEGTTFVVVL